MKKNEMDGACSTYDREERCIQGLVGRPERKKPLERPTRRCEDDIKMDIQGMEWGARTGLIWLRIKIGAGILEIQ
jgi:hypothetical protein